MTLEEAKNRIESIEAEERELEEMQYRYGYTFDRMTRSKLYQEKKNLKKQFNL